MILPHALLKNAKTAALFADLPRTGRVVDVGCGIRPCPAIAPRVHVCIEPHAEYVEHLNGWTPKDRRVVIVRGEAERLAEQPRKDTTVFLLDVIEHMEKNRGRAIVRLVEEFEHAVVFAPLGWIEQDEAQPDAWGMSGGFWQKHRSAWGPEDFQRGWQVHVWDQFHQRLGVGAFLAVR